MNATVNASKRAFWLEEVDAVSSVWNPVINEELGDHLEAIRGTVVSVSDIFSPGAAPRSKELKTLLWSCCCAIKCGVVASTAQWTVDRCVVVAGHPQSIVPAKLLDWCLLLQVVNGLLNG